MTGTLAGLSVASVLALIAGAAVLAARKRFAVVTVRGHSMLPAYADGDRLLVRRTAQPRAGDVLVFAMPEDLQVDGMKWLIKRVTAVAGNPVPPDVRPLVAEDRVPPGCLVVRGDGGRSLDSRQLGYVSTAAGLGVVLRRIS